MMYKFYTMKKRPFNILRLKYLQLKYKLCETTISRAKISVFSQLIADRL